MWLYQCHYTQNSQGTRQTYILKMQSFPRRRALPLPVSRLSADRSHITPCLRPWRCSRLYSSGWTASTYGQSRQICLDNAGSMSRSLQPLQQRFQQPTKASTASRDELQLFLPNGNRFRPRGTSRRAIHNQMLHEQRSLRYDSPQR